MINLTEPMVELRAELNGINNSLLKTYPVESCAEHLEAYPQSGYYSYVGPKVLEFSNGILEKVGPFALATYQKLLLLELISRNRAKVEKSDLPIKIKQLYEQNFARILTDVVERRQSVDFYHYDNDKFKKDIGLCNLRIIPAGTQKINRCKLPVGVLKRNGALQNIRFITYVVGILHGIGPVFDMHTDSHDPDLMANFSPEGWKQYYLNVADVMCIQTDIIGLFGIGWFFDPKLAQVSPRLAYLRELVCESGGRIFEVGPSAGARESALATSPSRNKLFEEGKYTPKDFLVVWDRKSLLGWAKLNNQ